MQKRFIYYIGFGFIIIALLLTGFVILTSHHDTALNQSASPTVTISVPSAPVLKPGGGLQEISYDIETSRFGDEGLNLIRVEIIEKETGKILQTLDGEKLRRVYQPPSGFQSSDNHPQNSPGDTPFPRIFVAFTPESGSQPGILIHRLTFTSQERAAMPFTVTGGQTLVVAGNNTSGI